MNMSCNRLPIDYSTWPVSDEPLHNIKHQCLRESIQPRTYTREEKYPKKCMQRSHFTSESQKVHSLFFFFDRMSELSFCTVSVLICSSTVVVVAVVIARKWPSRPIPSHPFAPKRKLHVPPQNARVRAPGHISPPNPFPSRSLALLGPSRPKVSSSREKSLAKENKKMKRMSCVLRKKKNVQLCFCSDW